MENRGNIGVVKGHQMIVRISIDFIPKRTTTHPRAEHLGNSLVVGRYLA